MIYINDLNSFRIEEDTVLTIGKFDGLHMGHKKLLDEVRKKQKTGLRSAIFTFNIPPQNEITHTKGKILTTNDEKHFIFKEAGIDYFIECPFTEEVRNLEAEEFIRLVVEKFRVKCFVVGTDCHFGHNRSGDYELLRKYASQYGYEVIVVEKKQFEGRDISSTFIREEIEKGNIERANLLLGYPYFIKGVVQTGNRIGNTIGFPTVNQIPEGDKLLPPYGVYAAQIVIGDKCYKGVSNIGIKPTIKGHNVCGVETNIFDFNEDVYGKEIYVRLFHFIRPEKKFDSLEELKAMIAKNSEEAEEILKTYKLTPILLEAASDDMIL